MSLSVVCAPRSDALAGSKVPPRCLTPYVSADAWVIANGTTGAVLAGSRHMDRLCVASMTKIVTASVVSGVAPGLAGHLLRAQLLVCVAGCRD